MIRHFDVLIVGAGHGGAQAAAALRQHGLKGSIGVIGDESCLPYERPPLSKDYLAGERPAERLLIRSEGFWVDKAVTFLLGQRVLAVDAAARRVTTEAGGELSYGNLVWAAGGRPRRLELPGGRLDGIETMRNLSDADRIAAALGSTRHVVILGGGFIGLEAAAVLRKQGKQVTLVEVQDRLLARVAGPAISDFYAAEHRSHGVEIRFGTAITHFEEEGGRVARAHLSDGEAIPADLVIEGIGIVPTVEPLIAAGAECKDGVLVDDRCRANLPNIFAIGDCARQRSRFAGGAAIRIESVQNATDQATTVALELCGKGRDHDAMPWFWSNQYDLRLQTVGISAGHDEAVLRGVPSERRFSVIYLKAGMVVALDCVNAPADFAQGRALVSQGARPDPALLADTDRPLRSVL